jgi:sulfatase maturation enzyme AslB (radical SAM superfamily)
MIEQEKILKHTNKLLQADARPRLKEYVELRKTSGPLVVELDPTSACNFRCPECINSELLNKGQIEADRLHKLLKEFQQAGVKGVIFIGGGEPLAHTSMPEPIVTAHSLGISIGLTTNGSLINRYKDEIAECVSWTRVSVDAANEKTFSKLRPSSLRNSFNQVIGNMKELAKSKKGSLGYSFLIMERAIEDGSTETNCNELVDAANLAKEIGCDYFEFKPMVDPHHNLVPFSSLVKESLIEQIPHLKSLDSDNFKVVFPDSVKHLLSSISPNQQKNYKSCPVLELRTLVTPQGIYACPYKRGMEEFRIGDLSKPFDEYWKSEQRSNKSFSVNPSKNCNFFCIRHEANILLNTLAGSYDKGVDLLSNIPSVNSKDIFI